MVGKLSSLLNSDRWLSIYVVYFFFGESYLRRYVLTDTQSNCLPLKLINLVHFRISWYNLLMIILLYVELYGKLYHTYFCQKKSCLHNMIEVLKFISLHLLRIQQSTFYHGDYVVEYNKSLLIMCLFLHINWSYLFL